MRRGAQRRAVYLHTPIRRNTGAVAFRHACDLQYSTVPLKPRPNLVALRVGDPRRPVTHWPDIVTAAPVPTHATELMGGDPRRRCDRRWP